MSSAQILRFFGSALLWGGALEGSDLLPQEFVERAPFSPRTFAIRSNGIGIATLEVLDLFLTEVGHPV
jgi:hypothetical protein